MLYSNELEKKMTDITETAQDATGLEGVVKIDELPWIDIGVGDNAIKVLRVCPETQQHTVLIRAPAGQVNQRHIHSGPADFYVIEGEIEYRGGTIKKGDWAYEAAGSLHEATSHPKDTLYLANIYGPVIFLKEDNSVDFILDWRSYRDMDAAARKLAAEQ